MLLENLPNKPRFCAKEAADILGVSVSTLAVYRTQRAGKNPTPKFEKIAGRIFYRSEDLKEWLNKEFT
jgi:hypothetical protein